jgi:hypothetical protein
LGSLWRFNASFASSKIIFIIVFDQKSLGFLRVFRTKQQLLTAKANTGFASLKTIFNKTKKSELK